jgi:superfamily II DNA or RNA helicase
VSVELQGPKAKWGGEYDLVAIRQRRDRKVPAQHQAKALAELRPWYFDESPGDKGAILVLPTGAGKTFTAVSFLCELPITQGRKVLWLAHSHHLLEQASRTFEDALPLIGGPKSTLVVRVVSGIARFIRLRPLTTW